MKKGIGLLFIGFVLGMITTGFIVWKLVPRMMLSVHKSRLPFEETVVAISASAIEHGRRVPKIYELQKNLIVDGYEDMTRMKIISLYHTDNAYRMLYRDDTKMAAAFLPWRMGVYETANGNVYVSRLNIGFMSRFYDGTISAVMAGAAIDERNILEHIVDK